MEIKTGYLVPLEWAYPVLRAKWSQIIGTSQEDI